MRSQSGQAGLARRARMIVMSADGVAFNEIRHRLDCDVRFIQRWRERFTTDRVAGLTSQSSGRPGMLPLSPGRAERHGFEYKRYGTLSLYAAFATRTGENIGKTASRHTSVEFVGFLGDIARQPTCKARDSCTSYA